MKTTVMMIVLAISTSTAALAGDKPSNVTVRPLYSGSDTYVMRDSAGKRLGTATRAPWSDDTLVLRDTQGRKTGTMKAK